MQIVIPLKNARLGDIVKIIHNAGYPSEWKLDEYKIILIDKNDRNLYQIHLYGMSGVRFREKDLILIERKNK